MEGLFRTLFPDYKVGFHIYWGETLLQSLHGLPIQPLCSPEPLGVPQQKVAGPGPGIMAMLASWPGLALQRWCLTRPSAARSGEA